MKPTFDDLLNAKFITNDFSSHELHDEPIIMVLDKIFDKFFPGLDKYDFDAAELNKKNRFLGI